MRVDRLLGVVLALCALMGSLATARADSPGITEASEVSFRLAARSTDRAYMGPHDKASALSADPDIYLVYRLSSRGFEARATARGLLHRTNIGERVDTNVKFGTLEFGPKWGATSLLLVWEPTYAYRPRTGRKIMEQQDVGLKLKRAVLVGRRSKTPVQFSFKLSYANNHPDSFSRVRFVADAQWTTRLGARSQINWAPELGFARYDSFFGKERTDLIFSLRATPRRELGGGASIGISFMGGLAASTHSQRSGYEFEVRPELRFRL